MPSTRGLEMCEGGGGGERLRKRDTWRCCSLYVLYCRIVDLTVMLFVVATYFFCPSYRGFWPSCRWWRWWRSRSWEGVCLWWRTGWCVLCFVFCVSFSVSPCVCRFWFSMVLGLMMIKRLQVVVVGGWCDVPASWTDFFFLNQVRCNRRRVKEVSTVARCERRWLMSIELEFGSSTICELYSSNSATNA